ncbi:MAG: XdhC family protein [Planctomycetaceae bacterium]|nr:XdhC family protein [Planctomycetaceae bacterium]
MPSLPGQLVDAVTAGRPACYTALVETRGSTPQKAGAQMLVFPDGSQIGTLGGGCVEAEVKRRALALLVDGPTEILTFTLDHDYGWDDGLICGGRMKMLVAPCRPGDSLDYYRRYAELIDTAQGCTEVVAVDPDASGFTAGTQLLFNRDGRFVTSPNLTEPTLSAALDAIGPLLRRIDARPRAYQAGGFSFLPQLPRCRLLIIGGGHVGQQVGQLAAAVDFDVWVIDDRETYCSEERFPQAQRRICAPFDQILPQLEIGGDDFCIIVTRGHQHDEQALYHLAARSARYIGMIGSKRKIRMIFEDLARAGIPQAALDRVHAPLGLDIGSQTVAEIAVSIVAELISVRNLEHRRVRPVDFPE